MLLLFIWAPLYDVTIFFNNICDNVSTFLMKGRTVLTHSVSWGLFSVLWKQDVKNRDEGCVLCVLVRGSVWMLLLS
jgi:hypothetical protein